MTVACHDGSAFADVPCPLCGAFSHVHESQLAGSPVDADVGCRCAGCGTIVVLDRDAVEAELNRSRDRLAT